MLDSTVLSLAERRIQLDLEERKGSFAHEVRRIKSKMIGQNMFQSSVTQQLLYEAIELEVRARAMLAWQVLARILSTQTLKVDPQIGLQLKELLNRYIDLGCEDLIQEHDRVSAIHPGSGVTAPWERMRSFALNKAETEVDLALLSVRQAQEQGAPNPIVNIYQPVGIVQTGVGSSATFIQNLGPAERRQLGHALEVVERSVIESERLSAREQDEFQEIIREAREEVEKEAPNLIRLRSVIAGIATTIQTLGSASGAYDLLKGAATLIGVNLP